MSNPQASVQSTDSPSSLKRLSILLRCRDPSPPPEKHSEIYERFVESHSHLSTQVEHIKTAYPTMTPTRERRKLARELDRTARTLEGVSGRLSSYVPYSQGVSGEPAVGEIPSTSYLLESSEGAYMADYEYGDSPGLAPTVSRASRYDAIPELSPPPPLTAGNSYSSQYPPITYIDSHGIPYPAEPKTPPSSSYYPPPSPRHSRSSYSHHSHLRSHSHSNHYSPKLSSVHASPLPSEPVYPSFSHSYSSSSVRRSSKSYHSGVGYSGGGYYPDELSYDRYESMGYEDVPYTRYS